MKPHLAENHCFLGIARRSSQGGISPRLVQRRGSVWPCLCWKCRGVVQRPYVRPAICHSETCQNKRAFRKVTGGSPRPRAAPKSWPCRVLSRCLPHHLLHHVVRKAPSRLSVLHNGVREASSRRSGIMLFRRSSRGRPRVVPVPLQRLHGTTVSRG